METRMYIYLYLFILFPVFGFHMSSSAQEPPPDGKPYASIDLMTDKGVSLVDGKWLYSDVEIIVVDFKEAGPDGQPSNTPNKAYDITPHIGGADFDDYNWQEISPSTLNQRRANGKLSFNWYRINITIPEKVGESDTLGSTVVFETSVDDYAEIWVNGELPRAFGQSGGSVIHGWNTTNRLIVGRDVVPGEKIQIAIFGINGPISGSPTNYIYVRKAVLDFYKDSMVPLTVTPQEVNVEVLRLDPALDEIVPANPKIFKLATGFEFTEGPVWLSDGYLLFSDPNKNTIYKYSEDGELSVFKENSGYAGDDVGRYFQPGSNGLTLDSQGRLTINEHGNRRVTRIEEDGSLTVLADKYNGKRLNSPNDLVYKSDGTLYITDPPFGLPDTYDDPSKELQHSGVYRITDREVELLASDLKGPNGIAFSPDEDYLYVSNWDIENKVIMRYPVNNNGTLSKGEVFFDMTDAPGEEALDGLKVDKKGNVYSSGPGGVWIISPEGKHIGTIIVPKLPANFAWGGEDGKTLYMTSRDTLYRMPLKVKGIRPQ